MAAQHIKSDSFDEQRFLKLVDQVTQKIDCIKCANCCNQLRTILNKEDIARISKQLNLTQANFAKEYLTKYDETHLEFVKLPCPLLSENRCKIYPARPEACKTFPYLEGIRNYSTHALLSNAKNCLIVYNVLLNLI